MGYLNVLSGNQPALTILSQRVQSTLAGARRPKTAKSYQAQFQLYLAFLAMLHITDLADLHVILAFMQLLADNNLTPATIANYVSAIKQSLLFYGISVTAFDNIKISLFLKSLTINRPLAIREQGIIDFALLSSISQACHHVDQPLMFRSIFLLAFFGFFRISNFAPVKIQDFDPTRHFARGDVFWADPGAHILLKWAKNLQTRDKFHIVQIPSLDNPLLCPVLALSTYFQQCRVDANAFQCVTQGKIRCALAIILTQLNIPLHFISFHSFRRSGATAAFNANVKLQNIQAHGGWRSSAVWAYLKNTKTASAAEAKSFQSIIPTTT